MNFKKGIVNSISNVAQTKSNAGYAVLNEELYVVGGHSLVGTKTAQKYSASADSWASIANLNHARYDLACAAANGKIYAFGGHDGNGNYFDYTEEYDPLTNSWTVKAPMPYTSEDHGAIEVNGQIFVFGGHNSSGYSKRVSRYDPTENKWYTWYSDMPVVGRNSFAITTDGRFVYIAGGLTSKGITNEFLSFDTVNGTWNIELPKLPTKRRHCRAAIVDKTVYVIGGYDANNNINDDSYDIVEAYVIDSQIWLRGFSSLSVGRDRFCIGNIDDKIYCVAGWGSGWYTSSAEVFDPLSGDSLFNPLTSFSLPNTDPIDKDNIEYIRNNVNAFRQNNGFAPMKWTDELIVEKQTEIKGIHWNEIQLAILEIYNFVGIPHSSPDVSERLNKLVVPRHRKDLIMGIRDRITAVAKGLKNSI